MVERDLDFKDVKPNPLPAHRHRLQGVIQAETRGLAVWGTTLSAPPGEQGKYIWPNCLCCHALSKREQTKAAITEVCEKIIFREAVFTTYHPGAPVQAAVNHRGSLQAFVPAHGIPRLAQAAHRAVKQRHTALSHPGFLTGLYFFCSVRSAPHPSGMSCLPDTCTTNAYCQSHPAAIFDLFSFFFPTLWLWGSLSQYHHFSISS